MMDPEARIIYALSLVVTAPTVVIGLARGDRVDGGTTLCMILVAFGLVGLIAERRGATAGVPRARVITPAGGRRCRPTPTPT